jgi:hypothetical protein
MLDLSQKSWRVFYRLVGDDVTWEHGLVSIEWDGEVEDDDPGTAAWRIREYLGKCLVHSARAVLEAFADYLEANEEALHQGWIEHRRATLLKAIATSAKDLTLLGGEPMWGKDSEELLHLYRAEIFDGREPKGVGPLIDAIDRLRPILDALAQGETA